MGNSISEAKIQPALPVYSTLETVYLGRQALYDRSLHSRAYELFYRSAEPQSGFRGDFERATCSVLLSAFAELGLDQVSGSKRVFLNVSHDVVTGALPLPVSPKQVVLQVRDFQLSAPELPKALAARRALGFQVALAGFEYGEQTAGLLKVCDFVKLSAARFNAEAMKSQVKLLGGSRIVAIGTEIETKADFQAAIKAGCRLLQGSYLFRPQLLKHKRLPKSLSVVTHLLRQIRDPNLLLSEVESTVKADPSLAVAVLRFVGSASIGLKHSVTSVSHAVGLLGLAEFSKWLTVVALTSNSRRPSEISLVALTRARACELLSLELSQGDSESAFTVGLFSMLEALCEQPLQRLLDQLPVDPQIAVAVSSQKGPLGELLTNVLSCESESLAAQGGHISAVTLNKAWLEALNWAQQAQENLT